MLHLRCDIPAAGRTTSIHQVGTGANAGASTRSGEPVGALLLAPEAADPPPSRPLPPIPRQPSGPAPSRPWAPANPVPKGIEVEFIALSLTDASRAVAHVLHGTPVADATLDVFDHKHGRWEVKYDGDSGEIASPILRTSSDLRRMLQVIRELRGAGAATNPETGLHMHVDGKTFSAHQVARLVALMAKYEPVIYDAFGVDFERQRLYCRPLSPHLVASFAQRQPTTEAGLLGAYIQGGAPNRFFGVNLTNRVPIPDASKKCTIEFRYFDSDLDERVTEDIAAMVEQICSWSLRGDDNLESFDADPVGFCDILHLDADSALRARLTASQTTWPLFEAMKYMSLNDLEAYSRKLNVTVAARAIRQMGRFGSAGLQLAKLAGDDDSALIRGAATAACAECVASLDLHELENFVNDPVPFVRMHALFRMHTALEVLPCADALALFHGSTARHMLMRSVCAAPLSTQSAQVIQQLLDESILPTEQDLATLVRSNPRVLDPNILDWLWRIYGTPNIIDRGRIAVLRMLLQSEPLVKFEAHMNALKGWQRLALMKDLWIAGPHLPDMLRTIFTRLSHDGLLKVQVCARSYLRAMAEPETEDSTLVDV